MAGFATVAEGVLSPRSGTLYGVSGTSTLAASIRLLTWRRASLRALRRSGSAPRGEEDRPVTDPFDPDRRAGQEDRDQHRKCDEYDRQGGNELCKPALDRLIAGARRRAISVVSVTSLVTVTTPSTRSASDVAVPLRRTMLSLTSTLIS